MRMARFELKLLICIVNSIARYRMEIKINSIINRQKLCRFYIQNYNRWNIKISQCALRSNKLTHTKFIVVRYNYSVEYHLVCPHIRFTSYGRLWEMSEYTRMLGYVSRVKAGIPGQLQIQFNLHEILFAGQTRSEYRGEIRGERWKIVYVHFIRRNSRIMSLRKLHRRSAGEISVKTPCQKVII